MLLTVLSIILIYQNTHIHRHAESQTAPSSGARKKNKRKQRIKLVSASGHSYINHTYTLVLNETFCEFSKKCVAMDTADCHLAAVKFSSSSTERLLVLVLFSSTTRAHTHTRLMTIRYTTLLLNPVCVCVFALLLLACWQAGRYALQFLLCPFPVLF